MPITFILDNARYQKCTVVKNLAAQLHIELVFLPPYSPNLNLIERLWKFVKKQCLYSKYYSEFAKFKNAIMDCLQKNHSQHKEELASLLTPNFQYNILLKLGKPDETEWVVMRMHPAMCAEIIGNHPGILRQTACILALTHHKKWDGSGYPKKLRGEEISLSGRIITIADVFDALTIDRPSKRHGL